MNIYKAMIAMGILLSVVLVISNMVNPTQAFVIIWYFRTYTLAAASIATGVLLGIGIHGFLTSNNQAEDDTYNF